MDTNCNNLFNTWKIEQKITFIEDNPKRFPELCDDNEKLCDLAVKLWPNNIKFIKNQTDKQCWLALKNSIWYIYHINKPTDVMITFAVTKGLRNLSKLKVPVSKELHNDLQYLLNSEHKCVKKMKRFRKTTFDSAIFTKIVKKYIGQIMNIRDTCEDKLMMKKKNIVICMYNYMTQNETYIKWIHSQKEFKQTIIKKLNELVTLNHLCDWEAKYYLNKINQIADTTDEDNANKIKTLEKILIPFEYECIRKKLFIED